MITEENEALYRYKDETEDIRIHLLESHIFIFSDDYQQMFTLSSGTVDPKGLYRTYPTIERVRKDAQMYTEGVTNIEKLMDGVHNLYKLRVIDEPDLHRLRQFASQLLPDTPPDSVVKQLVLCGYDNLAGVLHFSDEHPTLTRSCKSFYKFVCESRQFFANKK